jgi:hypothetical protein
MPRKLPKSATDQFIAALELFETACVMRGRVEHADTVLLEDSERKAEAYKLKIVKMFDAKGT